MDKGVGVASQQSDEGAEGYSRRQKRIQDAMALRKPDRVPVAPLAVHYYPNVSRGLSNREAHYDPATVLPLWKEVTIEQDWDAAPTYGSLPAGVPLELLGAQQIIWPGGGLPDHRPFQFVEREYMAQDEYDEMLADPTGFAIKRLWPRVATTLTPAGALAQAGVPPILHFSNSYMLNGLVGAAMATPGMVEMLEAILAVSKDLAAVGKAVRAYSSEMIARGYPFVWGAATFTAFDWISDFLRGLRGSLMDIYQVPDKLLAAIEMFIPWTIETTVAWANQTGLKGVFIPLHRGAGGFMSNDQFRTFYWPSLKALLLGLIEADLVPIPMFEGDYTSRLEFLQQLPPGKVVGHFDKVARRKARDLLGGTMCFWGNVPSSLLCTGTAAEVKADVKELIDLFGDTGALIVDGTVGIPDEAKPENVQAMSDAVREYGVL